MPCAAWDAWPSTRATMSAQERHSPKAAGESSLRVMRALNSAAQESKIRIGRLPSDSDSDKEAVRFRVLPGEKRQVNLSQDAKRARVENARATRAAHRQSQ